METTGIQRRAGIAVDVYRNLSSECYSVRARSGTERGRVIAHEDALLVRDAEFVVQPAGLERVREEERKNVHAFVRGEFGTVEECPFDEDTARSVMYDPYKYDSFVTCDTEEPVDAASLVWLSLDTGVLAVDVEV